MSSKGRTMGWMFGNSRLDRRLDHLTEQLSVIPVANLPQTLTNWAELKAGYRFVNNPYVSHEGIIEVERRATVERMARCLRSAHSRAHRSRQTALPAR
jgi:beta-xylosidase